MSIDNSGPAFPLADSSIDLENSNLSGANGITRREYFAAKAMAAMIVATEGSMGITRKDLCAEACLMADTMLAALAERAQGVGNG